MSAKSLFWPTVISVETLVAVGIHDYLFRNKSELGDISAFYSGNFIARKNILFICKGTIS